MNVRYKQIVNSEEIYGDLLEKIITLEYEPGEQLSENELCELYGTTRHAIRGALAVLKEKGLVEVVPQRGTYVTLIDLKMIDDILFLRSAIEQETLHVLFKNEDNSLLIQKLKGCLKRQIDMQRTSDTPKEYYMLDDKFHGLLMEAAGRANVPDLYADAFLHVRRWRNMEVGAQERIEKLPAEHQSIIDAIACGDEAEAHRCMNDHIDSVAQFGDEMKAKYPQFFVE